MRMRGARCSGARAAAVPSVVREILGPALRIVIVNRQVRMVELARANRPVAMLLEKLR